MHVCVMRYKIRKAKLKLDGQMSLPFKESEFKMGTTRICSHACSLNGKIMKILMRVLLIGVYLPTKFHVIPSIGC